MEQDSDGAARWTQQTKTKGWAQHGDRVSTEDNHRIRRDALALCQSTSWTAEQICRATAGGGAARQSGVTAQRRSHQRRSKQADRLALLRVHTRGFLLTLFFLSIYSHNDATQKTRKYLKEIGVATAGLVGCFRLQRPLGAVHVINLLYSRYTKGFT